MKCVLNISCLLAFIALTSAAPQNYKSDDSNVEIQKVEVIEVPYSEVYYLLAKIQQVQQSQQPETPQPQEEYGPPTTTEVPTTTEASNSTDTESAQLNEDDGLTEQGVYYIYHPTGLLQRVMYVTKDDARNMAYSAQLKYQNVEPIREPIYTYDPNTFVFQKLQV